MVHVYSFLRDDLRLLDLFRSLRNAKHKDFHDIFQGICISQLIPGENISLEELLDRGFQHHFDQTDGNRADAALGHAHLDQLDRGLPACGKSEFYLLVDLRIFVPQGI